MGSVTVNALLIEHDEAAASLIRSMLKNSRDPLFAVLHVDTLSGGLNELRQRSFDVVLVDLALPDCQGLDTALAVQDCSQSPVIVLASINDDGITTQSFEMGIQDYLFKEELNSSLLIRSIQYSMYRKRLSDQLQQSEERLRATLEKAAVGIGHVAPDGHMLWMNQQLCDILGYTKEEVVNLTLTDITHPDDVESTNQFFQKLLDSETASYTQEKRYVRKDGATIWIHLTASMVTEVGSSTRIAVGFVEDITARKQAEESLRYSEARFQALYRDNPVMIVTVDSKFTMLTVNPMTAQSLGYRVEELEGESVLKLFHEEDRAAVADQLRTCLEKPFQVFTWQFRKNNKEGELVWVEEFAQAVYDLHGAPNVLVVCQDITKRKKAEDALQEALRDLERSNRDLEQFAYLASHDLQEPLRMVWSYMQLLEKKYHDRLDEKATTYIRFAVNGAQRMQDLVEGLLAYSRIGSQKEFHPVDTSKILAEATENLMTCIRETHAEIASRPLPSVRGDAMMLLQLFQNLISNGIKYRKRDVPPRIRVAAEKLEGEWLFSVADNGIGIESGDFDRIFQIFQRLHTAEECPGTGIGLASCKRIVEQHHGRIWLESTPGKGTTFFFTIPANGQNAPEATSPVT